MDNLAQWVWIESQARLFGFAGAEDLFARGGLTFAFLGAVWRSNHR